jgi:hypothetical protein
LLEFVAFPLASLIDQADAIYRRGILRLKPVYDDWDARAVGVDVVAYSYLLDAGADSQQNPVENIGGNPDEQEVVRCSAWLNRGFADADG